MGLGLMVCGGVVWDWWWSMAVFLVDLVAKRFGVFFVDLGSEIYPKFV